MREGSRGTGSFRGNFKLNWIWGGRGGPSQMPAVSTEGGGLDDDAEKNDHYFYI